MSSAVLFEEGAIRRAVDLQRRSYTLLRWMDQAIEKGFISYDAAHTYATLSGATQAWIDRHYMDIPVAARPAKEDVPAFSALFATYLEGSFDLVREPGQRLYSPDAHCFCPHCSWLV